MRARDDSGSEVSWWFAYKLPHSLYEYDGDPSSFDIVTDSYKKKALGEDGYRYLFFKAGDTIVSLSEKDLSPTTDNAGAISRTLAQVLGDDVPDTVGYIAYNDEFPTEEDLEDAGADSSSPGKDSSGYGHNKGILAFDTADGSAFWMIHSFPRWPAPGQTSYPSDAESSRLNYGQSYLCISLRDLKTVDLIAWQMRRFHAPQIIHSRLPDADTTTSVGGEEVAIGGLLAELYALASDNAPGQSAPSSTGDSVDTAEKAGELTFQAWSPDGGPKATTTFHLFAKSKDWGEDFWIDLVSHRLGEDLITETWRRDSSNQTSSTALHTPHGTDGDGDTVFDASAVLLADLGCFFKEGSDHAKWAVGADAGSALVCVGDINRQSSQSSRGGGAAAFFDADLAATLRGYLWMTDRERAGEAEIKVDDSGNPIPDSDETDNQNADIGADAERDASGAASNLS